MYLSRSSQCIYVVQTVCPRPHGFFAWRAFAVCLTLCLCRLVAFFTPTPPPRNGNGNQLPSKKGPTPQLPSSTPAVESELDQMKRDMENGSS